MLISSWRALPARSREIRRALLVVQRKRRCAKAYRLRKVCYKPGEYSGSSQTSDDLNSKSVPPVRNDGVRDCEFLSELTWEPAPAFSLAHLTSEDRAVFVKLFLIGDKIWQKPEIIEFQKIYIDMQITWDELSEQSIALSLEALQNHMGPLTPRQNDEPQIWF